jgi:DNA-binding Lrp family transcriptional regulator
MTAPLTEFQKRLCNRLQKGLPITAQPYARIAGEIGCTEEQVLEETRRLKEAGILRRIATILDHRALGMHSTLVAAHVPDDAMANVTECVNQLAGVSHSYLRRHHFNLWFTLQDRTLEGIDATLADLHARCAIAFHSLPVVTMFKLDVFFDADPNCGLRSLDFARDDKIADCGLNPPSSRLNLTAEHRRVLSQLQGDLEIAPRPFDGVGQASTLARLQELVDLGVIRRVAAVVDHRKLGYVANVLFVAQIPSRHIVEAGRGLARFSAVSHCYERRTFDDWPHNLYAMLHGHTGAQVQETVDQFLSAGNVLAHELLPTEVELKKHPVRLSFAFDS